MALHLQVVTPNGQLYNGDVVEVLVPTTSGTVGILEHHANMTTVTKLGIVSIRKQAGDGEKDMDHYVITDGIAEVDGSALRIMVDDGEHAASIDEFEAEREHAAAKERLRAAQDHAEVAAVTSSVERSAMRVEASRLGRK